VKGTTRELAHLELIPLGVVQRHDQWRKDFLQSPSLYSDRCGVKLKCAPIEGSGTDSNREHFQDN
jgi:hypothetical protein